RLGTAARSRIGRSNEPPPGGGIALQAPPRTDRLHPRQRTRLLRGQRPQVHHPVASQGRREGSPQGCSVHRLPDQRRHRPPREVRPARFRGRRLPDLGRRRMKVTLVSHPIVTPEFYDRLKGTEMGEREISFRHPYVDDADLVPEAAGRVCYDSFDLPNPATRNNADYLANIRRQLHFSVLEHSNFMFHVAEVSRALLAEITRHRHLS